MGNRLAASPWGDLRAAVCVVAALVTLAGCAGRGEGAAQGGADTTADGQTRRPVVVLAAASLCEAFREIGSLVEASDGTPVTMSCDGSPRLVAQLAAGAPADVLATADERTMGMAVDQSLVEDPQTFASNALVLIVPRGNPAKVTGLDSTLDDAKLVVCDSQVPCGAATETMATRRGLRLTPASREHSVTGVRSKVQLGQADAGIVYATDAALAGDDVEVVEPVPADEAGVVYPIAITRTSSHRSEAEAFVRAVRGAEGQDVLRRRGFSAAPGVGQ